jgi:hypothetical protein
MICTVATLRPGDRGQRLLNGLDRDAVRRHDLLLDQLVERVVHPLVRVDRGRRAVQLDQVDRVHAEVAPAPVQPAAEGVEGEGRGLERFRPAAHLGRDRDALSRPLAQHPA